MFDINFTQRSRSEAAEGEYSIVTATALSQNIKVDVSERVLTLLVQAVREREDADTEMICPPRQAVPRRRPSFFSSRRVDAYKQYSHLTRWKCRSYTWSDPTFQ